MEMCAKQLFDKEFKEELIRNLNVLRKSSILCDITIRAEGKDFAAHRCVLTAASSYFRALFTSTFKENENNFVELKQVKCAALSEALQFMYTGTAKADCSNAQDLVMAADYLILPSLKLKASEFLQETVSASNCLALESFAVQFNCESLKKAAVTYKVKNFVAVVKSDDFKSLNFDKVKDLISRDDIIVSKEEEVYDAVIMWVKHDLSSRECCFPDLLKCVRIFSMSKYSLREILCKEKLVLNSLPCTTILFKALDAFLFPDSYQVLMQRPRLCLKRKELVVVLTGGHNIDNLRQEPTDETFGFVLSSKKWLNLPMMPWPRTRHAAAVCGGQLFVVGGNSDAPSAPLCYFNPGQNKWFVSDKALKAILHSSLVTHNEELYMIGGEIGNVPRVKCTKYNYKDNKWKEVSPMIHPRAAHCAVVLDELIYVMAGCDDNACLKSVECYTPSSDEWSQIADMNNARKFAAAVAATTSEKIIVVGGYGDIDCAAVVANSEIFDKSLNQWSLVSAPIVPRAACGIVSVEDYVYVFGGERESPYDDLDSVECYAIQEDAWSQVDSMPKRLICLQASLLQLPVEYT